MWHQAPAPPLINGSSLSLRCKTGMIKIYRSRNFVVRVKDNNASAVFSAVSGTY